LLAVRVQGSDLRATAEAGVRLWVAHDVHVSRYAEVVVYEVGEQRWQMPPVRCLEWRAGMACRSLFSIRIYRSEAVSRVFDSASQFVLVGFQMKRHRTETSEYQRTRRRAFSSRNLASVFSTNELTAI
jgi:hypothetical protein